MKEKKTVKKCAKCKGSGLIDTPNAYYEPGVIKGCFGGPTGHDFLFCDVCKGTGQRPKADGSPNGEVTAVEIIETEKGPTRYGAYEVRGVEICKTGSPVTGYPIPLTKEEDIKEGDKVLFAEPFTGDWIKGTVRKDGFGYVVTCGSMVGLLRFNKDLRNCWVCEGFYNERALALITFKE